MPGHGLEQEPVKSNIISKPNDSDMVLRFPVPLDKGNEGSGNEIAPYHPVSHLRRRFLGSSRNLSPP